MSQFPIELFESSESSYILLVKIAAGFYGISWVVTKGKDRNQGFASKLLQEIHNKYKGVYITKTNSAKNFYLKNGYKEVYSDDRDTILVFVNDKGCVNF
jgi:GNAT superfamily N-acetyltransferase